MCACVRACVCNSSCISKRYHNVTRNFVVGGKNVELEVLLFDSVIMTGNTGTLHANGTITEKPLNELKYESLSHRRFVDSRTLIWVPQHLP